MCGSHTLFCCGVVHIGFSRQVRGSCQQHLRLCLHVGLTILLLLMRDRSAAAMTVMLPLFFFETTQLLWALIALAVSILIVAYYTAADAAADAAGHCLTSLGRARESRGEGGGGLQYSTVQCRAVQYSTAQCSTVQCRAVVAG